MEESKKIEPLEKGYYNAVLLPTPVALDPATFNTRKGILTRYGKKILAEGAKYYSTLTSEDYNEPEESPGESGRLKKKFRSIDDPWEPC